MTRTASALSLRGFETVTFNFLYSEKKKGAPDKNDKLEACWRQVIETFSEPNCKLVIGGKSMGGRIASHLVAAGDPADGLLFLGYPLHPAGRPKQLRDAHLPAIAAPMLFVEGTRDPLCDLALLQPVLARLGRRATLVVIEDGDHSFHVRKSSGRDDAAATAEVIAACAQWLLRRKPGAIRAPRRVPAAGAPKAP
jgi:uncharacterized protein